MFVRATLDVYQVINTTRRQNGIILRTPPADCDGASTSQAPVAASAVATPPLTDVDGTVTSQISATTTADKAQTSTPWINGLSGCLVFSSSSKLQRNDFVSSTHGGVQLPAAAIGEIGKLRFLHTLDVFNVEGPSGKVLLRELKKLAQLRKLKLLGLNQRNWQDFCFAISGHGYLESLSVRLSDGQQDHMYWLDEISKPPKTIKSLKLYGGNVHVSPVWMKQLEGLTKGDFEDVELKVSRQDEMNGLMELQHQDMYHRLCVKPIQDCKLCYGWWNIEVLVIHCSNTESSLELSGVDKYLPNLKEVWLKGTCSESVK